jgi:hypothetical protein
MNKEIEVEACSGIVLSTIKGKRNYNMDGMSHTLC